MKRKILSMFSLSLISFYLLCPLSCEACLISYALLRLVGKALLRKRHKLHNSLIAVEDYSTPSPNIPAFDRRISHEQFSVAEIPTLQRTFMLHVLHTPFHRIIGKEMEEKAMFGV